MIKEILNKLLSNQDKALSFKAGMDLADLPVVTFYQGDKKINFLLDTGSNNCVIDSNFINNIEYTPVNVETHIFGLEGNRQKASMCVIKMSYKDHDYEYPYIIQDMSAAFGAIKQESGVTINGLLGSKFFNDFKYILDFNELIAYSKK